MNSTPTRHSAAGAVRATPFLIAVKVGVATVTLNRPERKNPLTFESYRELTDFFRACAFDDAVK